MKLEHSENKHNFQKLEGVLASSANGKSAPEKLGLLEEFSLILDKISLQLSQSDDFAAWTKIDNIQIVKEVARKTKPEQKRVEVKNAGSESSEEGQEEVALEVSETETAEEQEAVEVVEESESESEQEGQEGETEEVEKVAQDTTQAAAVEAAAHTQVKEVATDKQQVTHEQVQKSVEVQAEEQPSEFEQQSVNARTKVEFQAKPAPEAVKEIQVEEPKLELQPSSSQVDVVLQESAKSAGKSAEKKSDTSELLESIMKSLLDVKAQDLPAATQTTQAGGKESLIASLLTRQLLGKAAAKLADSALGATQATNSNVTDTGAAHKSEAKGAKMNAPKSLPKPMEARTMRQVEQVLKEAAKSKDGKTISLRLDPPSLGHVKVDVSLRDSALHARISAESAQVVTLLREKAAELQNILREIGLSVDTVSVSVRGDEQNSFDQEIHQQGDTSDQSGSGSNGEGGQEGGDSLAGAGTQEEVEDHWVA